MDPSVPGYISVPLIPISDNGSGTNQPRVRPYPTTPAHRTPATREKSPGKTVSGLKRDPGLSHTDETVGTMIPFRIVPAISDAGSRYSSGVRVSTSRATLNFLTVRISASFVKRARSKITFPVKSMETIAISMSLQGDAVPSAEDPNNTRSWMWIPFSLTRAPKNLPLRGLLHQP